MIRLVAAVAAIVAGVLLLTEVSMQPTPEERLSLAAIYAAIDHGAALWFHHGWVRKAPNAERFAVQPFDASTHVLRDLTRDVAAVHERAVAVLDEATIRGIVDLVPDEWLETDDEGVHLPGSAAVGDAYVEHLLARLATPAAWLPGGGR